MEEFSQYYATHGEKKYSPDCFQKKEEQRKELKKLGLWTGTAVLLYIIIQNGLFLLMDAVGLSERYLTDPYFSAGADIFLTVLGVLVPFGLVGKKLKQISGNPNPAPFEMPEKKLNFVFAAIACSGCIMLSNIISSFVIYFAQVFGYEFASPAMPQMNSALGLVLGVLRVALLTAIVEEYSLRGAVMGNLKKYGELFAVVMSAFVFAVMHGTIVQTPFAMLSGVALGYFCVKTGTLWTGVVAHAFNNALSVIFLYVGDFIGEEASMAIYTDLMYVIIIAGVFSFFVFFNNTKNSPLKKSDVFLKPGEKISAFVLNPTMIIAILFMIIITAETVTK